MDKKFKIFFVGDFITNSGPAIANKLLLKGLGKEDFYYSKGKGKISRILEFIFKTVLSDCVCFCGYSKLNILGLRITKFLKKRTFYLMHGYKTYESKINNESISSYDLKKINDAEKFLFKNVDKVFCVSKKFAEFMKENEPNFAEKFDYNFNGLDTEKIEEIAKRQIGKRDDKLIISTGGGVRQKNNLIICKAIEKLNREKGLKLKYIVIGKTSADTDMICSYDFVTYYESLPQEKVIEIMAKSKLYIQNSIFETFGLAAIEALISGCNLLLSYNMGAVDVLKNIQNNDVVFDTSDIDEIAQKIERILTNGNAERIKKGINEQINYQITSKQLLKKIKNYVVSLENVKNK